MELTSMYNKERKAVVSQTVGFFVECYIGDRIVQRVGPYSTKGLADDVAEDFVFGDTPVTPRGLLNE
jgi:hypothetical protein